MCIYPRKEIDITEFTAVIQRKTQQLIFTKEYSWIIMVFQLLGKILCEYIYNRTTFLCPAPGITQPDCFPSFKSIRISTG
jgi:hypothetical protein